MADKITGNYRIVLSKNHESFKICRVFFGADGSYYVTWPYHPERKAFLAKMTWNYAKDHMWIAVQDMIDTGASDDDEGHLKLSHHPDGFVQFSGEGILSGKDGDNIRGFGVMSWPLAHPAGGPAFGVVIGRIESFDRSSDIGEDSVILNYDDLTPTPGDDLLLLEGHYFVPEWRRFVELRADGKRIISLVHPAQAVVTMPVLLPQQSCALQGFIGLHVYTGRQDDDTESPIVAISSSIGNIRANEHGENLGDGLLCHYPRPGSVRPSRSIDYRRPVVPPHAIPGQDSS